MLILSELTIIVNYDIVENMRNPIAREKKNNDLRAQIAKLYKDGYSFREISKLLEISHEWVRKLYLSTDTRIEA